MSIDFSRLGGSSNQGPLTDPAQIFASLPRTHPYLRDVQGQVLQSWFERRNERDLLIKMNTGSGKTLVALLCLQSCLNERRGPAIYLAADRYLVGQTMEEARAQGFRVVDDPSDPDFAASRSICVVTPQRLFNGRSVFGTADTGIRTPIGSIVIDDTHACLAAIQRQFSITIPESAEAYHELLALFATALSSQSHARYIELAEHDPTSLATTALMMIPPWEWVAKIDQVTALLTRYRNEEWLEWAWPLLRDDLHLCVVAINSGSIEMAPPCVPVDRIPSFEAAWRRIFLTATLPDDSVLVTLAAVADETIMSPIAPMSASDMGDRMILAPHHTFPELIHDDLRGMIVELAILHNVVVIVPSFKRSEYWSPFAARILTAENIQMGVQELKDGHVGLVVFVNKYDGVDLPGNACEVLVIDGVPEATGPLQRIVASQLTGSAVMMSQQMQRVEQGMGRAVRSNEDHCAVILFDAGLAQLVYGGGSDRFGPATTAQLELSRELATMLSHSGLQSLQETLSRFLSRDEAWVAASRARLASVTFPPGRPVDPLARAERSAFDFAHAGRSQEAVGIMRSFTNAIDDPRLRGWVKQRAAMYASNFDPVEARQLQRSARADSSALLRVPDGDVAYQRLSTAQDQADQLQIFLSDRYSSSDLMLIGFQALSDRLSPDADKTEDFEQAICDLGLHLGFASQRPERDTGKGPDVLWGLQTLRYLVIECKSGSSASEIFRRDAEQLSNSALWFTAEYDPSCRQTCMMIHPSRSLAAGAYLPDGSRIMTFNALNELVVAVRGLGRSLASRTSLSRAEIAERLGSSHLLGGTFADRWARPPASH